MMSGPSLKAISPLPLKQLRMKTKKRIGTRGKHCFRIYLQSILRKKIKNAMNRDCKRRVRNRNEIREKAKKRTILTMSEKGVILLFLLLLSFLSSIVSLHHLQNEQAL